jgi:hypothetical protein
MKARWALKTAALGLFILSSSTCTLGLLDLVAFEVLSSEKAILYLGYKENGYGVARLGTTTGALEVFRDTVSTVSTTGCAISIDPRPEVPGVFYPNLYYATETPNRIMRIYYRAVDTPKKVFDADQGAATTCIRVYDNGPAQALAVYWSTLFALHAGTELGAGTTMSNLGIAYISSFEVDTTASPRRVYYLGLKLQTTPDYFGIFATNEDYSNEKQIFQIGRYVVSNLQLVDEYLYFVTQSPNGIYRIKADSSEPSPTLLLTPTVQPKAVAYDKVDGALYWIESDETTTWRVMKAGPGQTAGTPLLENLPELDPNGFCLYRP